MRGQRPRPLDERATRTPETEGTTIIPLRDRLRQLRAGALLGALLLSGCAFLDKAFAPAPRPWPVAKGGRARRDGRLLRIYGASLKSRAEAEKDAYQALEEWLWRLELGDDLPQRKAAIESVMSSREAKPVPSPIHEATGFSSVIELDLPTLQKKLGTHYD